MIKKLYCKGNPVLPAEYDESLSYMEVLAKVKKNLNDMADNQEEFDDRLEAAEGDIDALEGRMDTAEGDIDALEGRMDTAESDIDAVEGRMDTAESDIDAVEGRMDTAEGDIDAVEGRMDTAEGEIDAIQGQIGDNTLHTNVPRYNVKFTDHKYHSVLPSHTGDWNMLADGEGGIVQEEYYPPSEIPNVGPVYGLVMPVPVKGWDNKDVYSTTEKRIGTWINGKPIYSITKVFPYDADWCGVRTVLNHNIANIDDAINMIGRKYDSSNGSVQFSQIRTPDDLYTADNAYIFARILVNFISFSRTNFAFILGAGFATATFDSLIVTFEYTKTTDNPTNVE